MCFRGVAEMLSWQGQGFDAARGAGTRGQPADASMAQALYSRALAAGMERARVRLEALT